jgi:HK97 family phage prohead protease
MPYFISDTAEGCDGWATVKDDGEVMGCHTTKQDAIDQGLAIALAEGSTFEGERALRAPVPGVDKFTTEAEALDRADELGCEGTHTMDEDGQIIYMPCSTHEAYDEAANRDESRPYHDEDEDERRLVDLSPSGYLRAVARRAVDAGPEVVAVAQGNMTPAMWVFVRDVLREGSRLWGVGLSVTVAKRLLEQAEATVAKLEEVNEGRVKGEALSKMETRVFEIDSLEVREDGDGMHLEGYAALFNSRSENLGGFTETIAPGAFRASLKARNDIKMLWNHDTGAVLGSTRAGTLTLVEDERGLRVSATLPNTSHGRDARELISRGDVTGFSFGFSMPARGGDEWNAEGTERVLKSVRLFEVSLTPWPAYTQTNGTATVRGLDKVAHRADVDADALADALLKIENGEDITTDDRQLLEKVLSELAPEVVEPEPDKSLEMLALKKKKLELLMGL